jgi:hypothetical protein
LIKQVLGRSSRDLAMRAHSPKRWQRLMSWVGMALLIILVNLLSNLSLTMRSFSEGLAWIEKRGRYGYINKLGQIVIKPQFETPNDFSAGLSRPESWFH